MTLTIELSPEEAASLERDAQQRGVAPEERARVFVVNGLARETTKNRYAGLRDLFEEWQKDAGSVEAQVKKRDEASWAAAQESVRQNPLEI